MSEENKQAATESAEAPAKPEAEVASAPEQESDDFDQALSQFDEETKPSSEQPRQQKAESTDEIARRAAAIARLEFEAERDEAAMYEAVRGDFKHLSIGMIQGHVRDAVNRDPRLLKVWTERRHNPGLFNRMIKKLHAEVAAMTSQAPDKGATEAREAVAYAVRSGSKPTPEGAPPDYSKMSDGEFREAVRKQHGFTPL